MALCRERNFLRCGLAKQLFLRETHGPIGPRMRQPHLSKFSCNTKGGHVLTVNPDGVATPAFAVAYSQALSDGRLLAVADEEGFVSVLDTSAQLPTSLHCDFETHPPRAQWLAHENAIFDLQWAKDDRVLLTASGDQTIRVWDTGTAEHIGSCSGHTGSVKSMSLHPFCPDVFATGSRDGSIRIWDLRRMASSPDRGEAPSTYHCVTTLSDAQKVSSNRARRRSWRNGHPPVVPDAKQSVTQVLFLRAGEMLASAGASSGVVKLWDVRMMDQPVHELSTAEPAAAAAIHSYELPDTAGAEVDCKRSRGISSLCQDPQGFWLLATGIGGSHCLFDAQRPQAGPVRHFTGGATGGFYVKSCFSPDGMHILSGSADSSAYIWQVDYPHEAPSRLQGSGGEVTAVAWCHAEPDQIATCSDDMTLRLWKLDLHSDAPSPRPPRAAPRPAAALPVEPQPVAAAAAAAAESKLPPARPPAEEPAALASAGKGAEVAAQLLEEEEEEFGKENDDQENRLLAPDTPTLAGKAAGDSWPRQQPRVPFAVLAEDSELAEPLASSEFSPPEATKEPPSDDTREGRPRKRMRQGSSRSPSPRRIRPAFPSVAAALAASGLQSAAAAAAPPPPPDLVLCGIAVPRADAQQYLGQLPMDATSSAPPAEAHPMQPLPMRAAFPAAASPGAVGDLGGSSSRQGRRIKPTWVANDLSRESASPQTTPPHRKVGPLDRAILRQQLEQQQRRSKRITPTQLPSRVPAVTQPAAAAPAAAAPVRSRGMRRVVPQPVSGPAERWQPDAELAVAAAAGLSVPLLPIPDSPEAARPPAAPGRVAGRVAPSPLQLSPALRAVATPDARYRASGQTRAWRTCFPAVPEQPLPIPPPQAAAFTSPPPPAASAGKGGLGRHAQAGTTTRARRLSMSRPLSPPAARGGILSRSTPSRTDGVARKLLSGLAAAGDGAAAAPPPRQQPDCPIPPLGDSVGPSHGMLRSDDESRSPFIHPSAAPRCGPSEGFMDESCTPSKTKPGIGGGASAVPSRRRLQPAIDAVLRSPTRRHTPAADAPAAHTPPPPARTLRSPPASRLAAVAATPPVAQAGAGNNTPTPRQLTLAQAWQLRPGQTA